MGHIILYFAAVIYTAYVAVMHNREIMVFVLLTELLVPIPLFILCIFNTVKLKASIHIPVPATEKKEDVPVEITISNPFWFPVNRFKMTLICENTLLKTKSRQIIRGSAAGHGTASFSLRISGAACGLVTLKLKKIRIYDCIGIFFLTKRPKITESFHILPSVFDTHVVVSNTIRSFPLESDVYDTQKSGDDPSEVFQIREYQKGDRPQSIHWKLSARNDTLMVKEYSRPVGCAVVFFLDYRILTEPYLETLFSISFEMLNQQCRHYMVWYDTACEDIERMAMENSEDLYELTAHLLKDTNIRPAKDLPELYRQKYRQEAFAAALSLNQGLTLYKNGSVETTFHLYSLENSLAGLTMNI